MIKCPSCGHENADDSNFCAKCGMSLAGAVSSGDTTRVGPVYDASAVEEPATEDLSAEDQRAIAMLPADSALLIVRQGPAAGARFLINSDTTTAGTRAATSSWTTSRSPATTPGSAGARATSGSRMRTA